MLTRLALSLIPMVLLGACGEPTAPRRVSLEAEVERTATGIQYSYVVHNATEGTIYLPACRRVAALSFHMLLDGFEIDGMATICPADQDMTPVEVPAGASHQSAGSYGSVSDAYLRPYLMYARSSQDVPNRTVRARAVYVH